MAETLPDREPERPDPGSSREWLWRTLKPGGCILVLVLLGLFLATCFTWKRDPVQDYVPRHSDAYYAADIEALASELREELLPYLPPCSLRVSGRRVEITAAPAALGTIRAALTAHFDPELFLFTEETE